MKTKTEKLNLKHQLSCGHSYRMIIKVEKNHPEYYSKLIHDELKIVCPICGEMVTVVNITAK